MAEEKEKKGPAVSSQEDPSIETLLRDRQKLDEQLKEKFTKEVTIMFTDIKGSTRFFETYGDIEGRLMVQKHNEMLFPLVQKHAGRVIKTIGDAIMASFEDPVGAVRSAMDMQKALYEYNRRKKDPKDQIHIRIGVNSGEGLVEKNDIFGDVVNVAARVESLTEPDEIMVSGPVYEEVRKTDDILCRYANQTKVKGKEEPLDVFRVIWADEAAVAGLTRGAPIVKTVKKRPANKKRLEIDISREADILRITAAEKTEQGQSTIRPYEEMKVSMAGIDERCQEITELLNQANTRGKVSKDILAKLRDVGQVLFDDLLSAKAKETLHKAEIDDLIFHIEDSLVQIPWELLYDGEQFLCQKFNMGRIVKTKHDIMNIKQRDLSRPLKMLIVSDPRGDLEKSSEEGRSIKQQLDSNTAFISANQRSGQVTPEYLRQKIRNFDMFHYAGHADYDPAEPSNSSLLLEGGKLTSADIMKLINGRPMPALVFCNACRTGQTEEWKIDASYNQEIFGLANAFLLSGVQHYVGTFWEILDEPGAHFAKEFYRAMMEGTSIGEALHQARMLLIKEFGEDTIVWASYMLYGDPGFNYFDFAAEEEEAEQAKDETASQQDFKEASNLRSPSSKTVSFESPPALASHKMTVFLGAAFLVIAVALVALFLRGGRETGLEKDPYRLSYTLLQAHKLPEARRGFEGLGNNDPRRFEGLAAVFYEGGDYAAALEMCEKSLEIAPDPMYARVINGHILLAQGNLDSARKQYEAAVNRKGGIPWQKAEALNGMARIYSTRGETEKAVEFYGRAAALNPQSSEINTNYGVAMQKTGNRSGALSSFEKAAAADSGDPYAAVLLAQAQKNQKAEADKARQERIDRLVSELAETFKAGTAAPAGEDLWTSGPLTISFLDFIRKGAPAAREGEDDFFLLKLSALLQESGRVQVVERELLDKLLAELKLSATDLVNPDTALKLGRILSARVIATNTIMRYGSDVQVAVRLTDTETTALKGVVAESAKDLEKLTQTVAQKTAQKIIAAYPIRGKVLSLEKEAVVLNIGSAAGVQKGMQFQVLKEIPSSKGRVRRRPAGTLTITSVEAQECWAAIPEGLKDLTEEMKVEQLIQER